MSDSILSPGTDERSGHDDTERVADPDDYNLRRRLKQIHDAKERVKQVKDERLGTDMNGERGEAKVDRPVAEKVTDYIHELRPTLQQIDREEPFLSEEVAEVNDTTVTLRHIMQNRGYVSGEESRYSDGSPGSYLSYELSMTAWDICNEYFEEIAGAVFEGRSPAPGANPVDPAGRFNE